MEIHKISKTEEIVQSEYLGFGAVVVEVEVVAVVVVVVEVEVVAVVVVVVEVKVVAVVVVVVGSGASAGWCLRCSLRSPVSMAKSSPSLGRLRPWMLATRVKRKTTRGRIICWKMGLRVVCSLEKSWYYSSRITIFSYDLMHLYFQL